MGKVTVKDGNGRERAVTMDEMRSHESKRVHTMRMTPYERTRAAVYATGNKWAIENFNATH